jgi:hypothetical protein
MLPRNGVETARQTYNGLIRTNHGSYSDALADVETIAIGAAGANTNLAKYVADQIHPNQSGHDDLKALIIPNVIGLLV